MIEWRRREFERAFFVTDEIRPADRAGDTFEFQRVAAIRNYDNILHTRNLRKDPADFFQTVEFFAAIAVDVGGEQHFRRDLAEAVDDATDAEIRRARRPHRAQ